MPVTTLAADPLWSHRVAVSLGVGGLIIAEMAYRTLAWRQAPSVRTTTNDGVIFAVDLVLRGLSLPLRLTVFGGVAAWAPLHLEPSVATVLPAYVLVDFIYYWKHRLFHRTKLGWALHCTHHSSRDLNFLATFRVNGFETIFSYLFFAPLALLGLPAMWLFFLVEINDGWQFVCHTRLRTPWKRLERWVNTPNIHRVHHCRGRELADCNYGSTFMIWDRWFGTYRPGQDAGTYGIENDERLTNPLAIQFRGLWALLATGWHRGSPP